MFQILIVDDDKNLKRGLSLLLTDSGYRTFSAGSARLPWVWLLASRITLRTSAGLLCISSAISRNALRLSRMPLHTRSSLAWGTGSRTSSRRLIQAARELGFAVGTVVSLAIIGARSSLAVYTPGAGRTGFSP